MKLKEKKGKKDTHSHTQRKHVEYHLGKKKKKKVRRLKEGEGEKGEETFFISDTLNGVEDLNFIIKVLLRLQKKVRKEKKESK